MKVLHSWLTDFVALPFQPKEIAQELTGAGLETAYEVLGTDLDPRIVIARVATKERHPDAEKLSLCQVDDGSGELRQVVCGAQNFKTGDTVVLAVPGARVPSIGKLKKSKIRGQVSMGMLCSAQELGLGTDHSGIMVLNDSPAPGTPARDVLAEPDALYEFEVYANRPDCMSVMGIAREIAAVTGNERTEVFARFPPQYALGKTATSGRAGDGQLTVDVRIEDGDGCPRYVGAIVDGVSVGPSDPGVAKRLEAAGVRPINNVVDCTNLVLLELGQPVHAFDLKKLSERTIIVRGAAPQERMTTLDGQERVLETGDLLICDGSGPQALAGVMGGADSEVADDTTTLFLELAYFTPERIRKTSRRIGLATESSARFVRGVDPSLARAALDYLVDLLQRYCGGRQVGDIADLIADDQERATVTARTSKIAELMGMSIQPEDVSRVLTGLFFRFENLVDDDEWVIQPPLFRFDINEEVDIVEEVGRLVGFHDVRPTLPGTAMGVRVDPLRHQERRIRRAMVGHGFSETIGYAMVSPQLLEKLPIPQDGLLELLNPLSEEGVLLRPSLLPSLLQQAIDNLDRGIPHPRLFELRNSFAPGERTGGALSRGARIDGAAGGPPANETRRLAAVWVGPTVPPSWVVPDGNDVSYPFIKGIVDSLCESLGWRGVRAVSSELPAWLDRSRAARLVRGPSEIGYVGRLSDATTRTFGFSHAPMVFEMDIDSLGLGASVRYQPFSRYPRVERDIALLMDQDRSIEPILAVLKPGKLPDLVEVSVFDEYRGSPLPDGMRSVGFRLHFQRMDGTMNEDDAQRALERAIQAVQSLEGVRLRDGGDA